MLFPRIDQSLVARWWWTVDRINLFALAILMLCGIILSLSASPAVALRLHYGALHFFERHLASVPVALAIMIGVSLLSPRWIKRIAIYGFIIAMVALALTFVVGIEIKGSRRWIDLPGLSLQPSEFVKPTFAIVAAWLFSEQKERPEFPGNLISIGLFVVIVVMLIKQPDLGMTGVIAVVWLAQFFMVGLRLYWAAIGGLGLMAGVAGAYVWMPHVTTRINQFLDHGAGAGADANYQVNRSLEAFASGGLWGRGPGEGLVKDVLPDAHADFVFAVAGEEFGLIACLFIVALFAFIVLRGLSRLVQENNLFVLLGASGLLIQFGLQAIINMASTVHLIPTKGMTLPFLSYGGSSMLSLALGMGMVLALTRRRLGGDEL
ncbi:MAG TPA: putative peptidoglycan glycosyltransferase FtsW [Stellaceae bacterium]|jgi:cell division protein FtsW